MPLISIIIPTYNAAATLARALDSIASQTYQDIEVILQDGLSTDETVAIATSYTAQIPSLIIKREADQGIYDAMNKALGYANGQYIYILGSDDTLYANDTLARVASKIETFSADVIYGDVISPRFKGRYNGPFTADKIVRQNICHQALFMHRKVYEQIGFFDLQYPAQADWHHNMKWVLDAAVSRQYIDLIVANYADGGFSSVNDDLRFRMHKGWLGYRWGKQQLSLKVLRDSFLESLRYCQQEGQFWWALRYRLMIILVKLKLKLTQL